MFYVMYLSGLCRRRSWTDPQYSFQQTTYGFTCQVRVNEHEFHSNGAHESIELAQNSAAVEAYMACRHLSMNESRYPSVGSTVTNSSPSAASSSSYSSSSTAAGSAVSPSSPHEATAVATAMMIPVAANATSATPLRYDLTAIANNHSAHAYAARDYYQNYYYNGGGDNGGGSGSYYAESDYGTSDRRSSSGSSSIIPGVAQLACSCGQPIYGSFDRCTRCTWHSRRS